MLNCNLYFSAVGLITVSNIYPELGIIWASKTKLVLGSVNCITLPTCFIVPNLFANVSAIFGFACIASNAFPRVVIELLFTTSDLFNLESAVD